MFVFGSSSQIRLQLLKSIGFCPDFVLSPSINEDPLKHEKPDVYVQRMAYSKMIKVLSLCKEDVAISSTYKTCGNIIVLTADTVITRNCKILRKVYNNEEIEECLRFLSGKTHQALTAVCLAKNNEIISKKLVCTKIKLKHLNERDIQDYIDSKIGMGKNAGYCLEGLMGAFVKSIVGSPSNVLGLPKYETRNMLISAGL